MLTLLSVSIGKLHLFIWEIVSHFLLVDELMGSFFMFHASRFTPREAPKGSQHHRRFNRFHMRLFSVYQWEGRTNVTTI